MKERKKKRKQQFESVIRLKRVWLPKPYHFAQTQRNYAKLYYKVDCLGDRLIDGVGWCFLANVEAQ